MGKNKLKKFEDMDSYPHVFQFPFSKIQEQGGLEDQGGSPPPFKITHDENPRISRVFCYMHFAWWR